MNIVLFVALRYGTTVADILGPSRRREHVVPRQLAIFLVHEHCRLSLPQLGLRFGGRDHTTILYSIRKVRAQRGSA